MWEQQLELPEKQPVALAPCPGAPPVWMTHCRPSRRVHLPRLAKDTLFEPVAAVTDVRAVALTPGCMLESLEL